MSDPKLTLLRKVHDLRVEAHRVEGEERKALLARANGVQVVLDRLVARRKE